MERLFSDLASHGVLGLLLAIALLALYKMFNKYEESQRGRREDALAYQEDSRKSSALIGELNRVIHDVADDVAELRGRGSRRHRREAE